MLALLWGHAAVTGRGRGSDGARAPSERLLGGGRERSKTHAGNRDRNFQSDRLACEPTADRDLSRAFLAITLQWIAAHRCAQEQQVVEMRQPAFGAEATDVINARRR